MLTALCLAGGGLASSIAATLFTLQWIHSVERLAWQEDWRLEGDALVLVEARIRGSGAGMDPPQGAVLRDGVWHYRTERRVAALLLSSGGSQPEYVLCAAGECRPITAWLGGPAGDGRIELFPCRLPPAARTSTR
ncbi:MAG: DUF1850 domain-containing protein [Rhodocyclaceae bacterium]|nr:DUF1850 domain-containing protein [Rhodocyclaceae bacterium]